jgi:hypothetical protein
VDVKTDLLERQLAAVTQERDQWEAKAEVRNVMLSSWILSADLSRQDATLKYKKAQQELDELVSSMEGL